MHTYLQTLKNIYENGFDHGDRTGTGRRSLYSQVMRFNMEDGFPIVTTRKIPYRASFVELFWFIRGSNNIKELHNEGLHIWDSWAVDMDFIKETVSKISTEKNDINEDNFVRIVSDAFEGSIGPMYGYLWRHAPISSENTKKLYDVVPSYKDIASDKLDMFKKLYDETKPVYEGKELSFEDFAISMAAQKVDQLQNLILSLKNDPFSARHVMTAWVPEYISIPGISPKVNVLSGKGALAPCHAFIQCFVTPGKEDQKNKLSLSLYQRSADFPIGSCFNIAQYALLLHLLAHVSDMEPLELIYHTGDTHIYLNQLELVEEQLKRDPLPLPKLKINTLEKDLFKIKLSDIEIIGYESHPPIKYPISV
jgi:thymidylate synthase